MKPTSRFLFAADLDGTLLPNTTLDPPPGCLARTQRLLDALLAHDCPVCFISGRHLALARQGQQDFDLPQPSFWLCNVGSEIYDGAGVLDDGWQHLLGQRFDHDAMWRQLADIPGIRPQEDEKQGPHKFSLYAEQAATAPLQKLIASRMVNMRPDLRLVTSVEEATARGLIDILPRGAGKAAALHYICDHAGFDFNQTFFAGDSGNDLDALISGVCGTLVGNAPADVRHQAEMALAEHPAARIHFARAPYGDGVIEGLHAFALLEEAA